MINKPSDIILPKINELLKILKIPMNHNQIMMEQLLSFKWAGASLIASYFAEEAVNLI